MKLTKLENLNLKKTKLEKLSLCNEVMMAAKTVAAGLASCLIAAAVSGGSNIGSEYPDKWCQWVLLLPKQRQSEGWN